MERSITICTIDELRKVAELLSDVIHSSKKHIVLLQGNLGAGKTALVKEFIAIKSEAIEVDSPTFSIVNEYSTGSETIYHFDLYRLDSIEEIEDFGFWDYVESGNTCFIEWPDKMADLLPQEKLITVAIKLNLKQCRDFTLHY